MAERMYMDPDDIEEFVQEVLEKISSYSENPVHKAKGILLDKDNMKFEMGPKKVGKRATIAFNAAAYTKFKSLVDSFETEISWTGVVKRIGSEMFYVRDVLVHPQVVSPVLCDTDEDAYQEWLETLDDETFNDLKLQGHSHVNMGVTPSGTDWKHREERIAIIPNDSEADRFFIFLIFNKRGEWSGQIYDFTNNVLYDTADIDIQVDYESSAELDIKAFIDEARVKARRDEKFKVGIDPLFGKMTYYNGIPYVRQSIGTHPETVENQMDIEDLKDHKWPIPEEGLGVKAVKVSERLHDGDEEDYG